MREVLTIARALDLATHSFGAKYLMSEPAEVQLRRLYSVCLAAKLGSYNLSQHLEELPGEGLWPSCRRASSARCRKR